MDSVIEALYAKADSAQIVSFPIADLWSADSSGFPRPPQDSAAEAAKKPIVAIKSLSLEEMLAPQGMGGISGIIVNAHPEYSSRYNPAVVPITIYLAYQNQPSILRTWENNFSFNSGLSIAAYQYGEDAAYLNNSASNVSSYSELRTPQSSIRYSETKSYGNVAASETIVNVPQLLVREDYEERTYVSDNTSNSGISSLSSTDALTQPSVMYVAPISENSRVSYYDASEISQIAMPTMVNLPFTMAYENKIASSEINSQAEIKIVERQYSTLSSENSFIQSAQFFVLGEEPISSIVSNASSTITKSNKLEYSEPIAVNYSIEIAKDSTNNLPSQFTNAPVTESVAVTQYVNVALSDRIGVNYSAQLDSSHEHLQELAQAAYRELELSVNADNVTPKTRNTVASENTVTADSGYVSSINSELRDSVLLLGTEKVRPIITIDTMVATPSISYLADRTIVASSPSETSNSLDSLLLQNKVEEPYRQDKIKREDLCAVRADIKDGEITLGSIDDAVSERLVRYFGKDNISSLEADGTYKAPENTVLAAIIYLLDKQGLVTKYVQKEDGMYIHSIQGIEGSIRVAKVNKETGEKRYITIGLEREQFNPTLERMVVETDGKVSYTNTFDMRYFSQIKNYKGDVVEGAYDLGVLSGRVSLEEANDTRTIAIYGKTENGELKASAIAANSVLGIIYKRAEKLKEGGLDIKLDLGISEFQMKEGKLLPTDYSNIYLRDIDVFGRSIVNRNGNNGLVVHSVDGLMQRSELLKNGRSVGAADYIAQHREHLSVTGILQGVFDNNNTQIG